MSRTHSTANYASPFTLHPTDDNIWSHDQIQCALLADILKELQKLNMLMHCHNTVEIPRTLKRIDKRLAKRMPLR